MRELTSIASSNDRVHNVLQYLHMKKLLVLNALLTVNKTEKRVRMNVSKDCLDMFKCDPTNFLALYHY